MNATTDETTIDVPPPAGRPVPAAIGLMLGYCDAIDRCKSIPIISAWPTLRLLWKIYLWALAFDLAWICMFFDLFLILIRKVFGRPRFLLGRIFYKCLAGPWRSAWTGELPLFRIARSRYLTRVLLCYHARAHMDLLQNVSNRRHLELLSRSRDPAALADAETLQDTFDVFDKITADRYQIRALVVFGPLLTLFSLITQKFVIPYAQKILALIEEKFGWSEMDASALLDDRTIQTTIVAIGLVVLYAIWLLASAWMDKRATLKQLGIEELETIAFADAGIRRPREIPFDLLALLVVSLGFSSLPFWSDAYSWLVPAEGAEDTPDSQRAEMQLDVLVFCGFAISLGLIALARRVYLAEKRTVPPLSQI